MEEGNEIQSIYHVERVESSARLEIMFLILLNIE
jgi:hypothetical protein